MFVAYNYEIYLNVKQHMPWSIEIVFQDIIITSRFVLNQEKFYVKCIFRENVPPKNVIKPFSSKSRLKYSFLYLRIVLGKKKDRVTGEMFLNSDFQGMQRSFFQNTCNFDRFNEFAQSLIFVFHQITSL